MTVELSRRLLAAGVPSADIEAALFLSVARGIPMARALVDRGVVSERVLEEELARLGGVALRQVAPASEIWARLPVSMCRRLGAVPLRTDASSGTVEVAAVDPLDPHVASEFGFHLGAPVRVQRATLGAIEEAVRRLELGETEGALPSRARRRTPAFPHGAPKSSAPPPPLEDVPIPLVRRVSLPALPPDDEISLVTPRPSRAIAVEPHQRAVSFPSSPPPPGAPPAAPPPLPPADPPSFPTGLAPRRTHTPALGSLMVSPQRSVTPPLGTLPAVMQSPPPSTRGRAAPADAPPLRAAPADAPPLRAAPIPDAESGPDTEKVLARSTPRDADAPAPPPAMPAWAPSETLEATFRRASVEIPAVTPPSVPPAAPSEPPPSEGAGARVEASDVARAPTEVAAVAPMALAPEPRSPKPAGGERVAMSLEEALDLLGDAQGRDGVVTAALTAMQVVASRCAVFVVRREGYCGWSCTPEFGDEAILRAVVIPHKTPSIFATAAAAGFYLGPVPGTPGHAALLAAMRQAGPDVAVSVVRVAGKPAMVLVVEGLDDSMRGTKALGEIARVAGFALSRVLATR